MGEKKKHTHTQSQEREKKEIFLVQRRRHVA